MNPSDIRDGMTVEAVRGPRTGERFVKRWVAIGTMRVVSEPAFTIAPIPDDVATLLLANPEWDLERAYREVGRPLQEWRPEKKR